MAKYKSKIREKLKAAAKRSDAGGRSLTVSNKGRTAEKHYKEKKIAIPKGQRQSYFQQIAGKLRSAGEKRAHEVLGGKLKEGATGAHRSLTGITHPAELMPAIKAGMTVRDIIKRLTGK